MAETKSKTAIVVNPNSGGGTAAQQWWKIKDEVNLRLKGAQVFMTTGTGDASRFAKEIATSKFDMLVVAGGDGTIHEVINGLFNDDGTLIHPGLCLAILSTGRGCDYIKSLRIPADFRDALAVILDPAIRLVDVGLCLYKDEFGRSGRRFFANSASAGLSGIIAKKVNQVPRLIPPNITYLGATAASFFGAKGQLMSVTVDGSVVFDGRCLAVMIANGGYSGSGMCWAPNAKLDDGKFDIVIAEMIPKYRIIVSAHKLFDGSFNTLPQVHSYSGKSVSIQSRDDVLIELDGEQPGVVPAEFQNLPKTLRIAVPR